MKWEEVAGIDYTAEDRATFEEAVTAGRKAIAGLRDALSKGDNDFAKKAGNMIKKSYKKKSFSCLSVVKYHNSYEEYTHFECNRTCSRDSAR